MPLLAKKVCIITGGAGSLGLASAKLFLSEGAKVMLVDLIATSCAPPPNSQARMSTRSPPM